MTDWLPPGRSVNATTQLPIWLVEQIGLKNVPTRMILFHGLEMEKTFDVRFSKVEPGQDSSATSPYRSIIHNFGQH
jgi:hypothetical protein